MLLVHLYPLLTDFLKKVSGVRRAPQRYFQSFIVFSLVSSHYTTPVPPCQPFLISFYSNYMQIKSKKDLTFVPRTGIMYT